MSRRAIETKWTCKRSGDCCLTTYELVVSWSELKAMRAATTQTLTAVPHQDEGFASVMMPGGCLLLTRELDGTATCSIHESRPYNCRRFQCQRPDPATEPFETGGPLGCKNLSDRLDDSLHALTFYASNQRRAQQWARAHGWTP